MAILQEILTTYGTQLLMTVITAIFGYMGTVVKRAADKYINSQIKRDIVSDCVKFVEQIYTDLHGDDKLKRCIEVASDRLNAQNVEVDEVELWMMIEAAVQEFNKSFNRG